MAREDFGVYVEFEAGLLSRGGLQIVRFAADHHIVLIAQDQADLAVGARFQFGVGKNGLVAVDQLQQVVRFIRFTDHHPAGILIVEVVDLHTEDLDPDLFEIAGIVMHYHSQGAYVVDALIAGRKAEKQQQSGDG
jgi:hypothetical protein